MGSLDYQLVVKSESTYNTAVTVDRAFEYDSENIKVDPRRTGGDPLRSGSFVTRYDRFTPYIGGAAGTITMPVMTGGFGWWLTHMLGGLASSGPVDSAYTHTGTMASLYGKSFTAQVNRPLYPAGTNEPFTFAGGKIPEWTLKNSVDENLMAEINVDFANLTTATALVDASALYTAGMDNLTWAGGVITIGGTAFDVDEFSLTVNNGMNVDRRKIAGDTDKKEPKDLRRSISWSIKADFESLTQYNRAIATTRGGTLAAITATWTGPTLIGVTTYPSLTVTLPSCRFDDADISDPSNTDPTSITLSGETLYDTTNEPITVAYVSTDATA